MNKLPSKFTFNLSQLALAFSISKPKVSAMLQGIDPIEKRGSAHLYNIADVATLNETRDAMIVERITNHKYKKPHHTNSTVIINDEPVNNDPEKMTSIEKINFYKAEDLRQSAILKEYKNDVESGKLMVAANVERTVADAFKKIALVLDTLPDLLERDGIIGSGDIEKVINVLDRSREQLAIDLSSISPETDDINDRGVW